VNEQRPSSRPSTTEQILDLLLDALLERQASRQAKALPPPAPAPPAVESNPPTPETATRAHAPEAPPPPAAPPGQPVVPPPDPRREPLPGEAGRTPPGPAPSIHLGRTLSRLSLVLATLVVLVNIPLNRSGLNMAHLVPSSASLIIRDGLVLKGSSPEIYVLQDNKLRWISSLEAFQFFGYQWEQVHVVEDTFLQQFEKGRPIHVLLKCESSPHIYALENDHKRWIKDIPTFTAEGYVWADVKFVSCDYLRGLPDGLPIPEDAGPPPQP
jgi:hypothetical protein